MLPDTLRQALHRVRARLRLRLAFFALATGGAMFGGLFAASGSVMAGLLGGAAAAAYVVTRGWRITLRDAARVVEGTTALDNLVVTAAEIEEQPRPVSVAMRAEIDAQAAQRIGTVSLSGVVPLVQPVLIATAVTAGCLMLTGVSKGDIAALLGTDPTSSVPVNPGSFSVQITPPAYTGRKAESLQDPVQVTAIAGSRIQIAAIDRDWVATQSEAIEIKTHGSGETRFLSVMVVPDLPPTIRIITPGKDTAFAQPSGQVPIAIQSADDLGLTSLSLRFTKAAGGGENVSFTEGEVPLTIERTSAREWRANAELSLEALGLADGDILVYRAVTRDSNPNAAPVQSDQYVIEIGKNADIADAGFALPTEEKKYAISQQMVIYKTEQLLKNRPADFLDESRGLAMEQRMVRAEVVFLGGGDVQDEVEEAAHSHELAEGRLENAGRAEMLRAINAMSRAETLLNDGNAKQALVFEREALVHLERALDRRRYFLRTLPDRSRIDVTRRLTGERREARSWQRAERPTLAAGSLAAQRSVMSELAAMTALDARPFDSRDVRADSRVPLAQGRLAARLAAIDPASVELQKAAVALASAANDEARKTAASAAMSALTHYALQSLPGSTAVGVRRDPLAGRLADEMRPRQ